MVGLQCHVAYRPPILLYFFLLDMQHIRIIFWFKKCKQIFVAGLLASFKAIFQQYFFTCISFYTAMNCFKITKFDLFLLILMQDILFRYPDSQNFIKFKKIRGLFLTLSDLMPSVTGTELKTYVHLFGILDIIHLTLHSNYIASKCVLQSGLYRIRFCLSVRYGRIGSLNPSNELKLRISFSFICNAISRLL